MKQTKLDLVADYFQFYLQDEHVAGDLSESWTPEALVSRVALAPGTLGVSTARNVTVPVEIEILDFEPRVDLSEWDHAVECDIELSSGSLVVAGCTDYFPAASRFRLSPGLYRTRILFGAMESLSEDGLQGEDHYKVSLWPTSSRVPPQVLKQFRNSGTAG